MVIHSRRVTLHAVATAALLAAVRPAAAQTYPDRAIRLVVPYSTGGGTDQMARLIAQELGGLLQQSIVVENKPGAGAVLGTDLVAKARPDGHTLGLVASAHAIAPALYRRLPYDPVADFTPIAQVATGPNVIVVNAETPERTLGALIERLRRAPDRETYGSAGVGNPTHLAAEEFQQVTSTKLIHVPYKGSGQAEAGLAGGEITLMIDSIPAALPFLRAGKTRALAVTAAERYPLLPDVPTTAEAGLPGFEPITWWGLLGPAGLPTDVVAQLNARLVQVLSIQSVREQFLRFGATPKPSSPPTFGTYIRDEIARLGAQTRALGIEPQP